MSSAISAAFRGNYATSASRWLAVSTRETAADGQFVYCVKTTGIYCRPVCKARLARRSNVVFHDTPALAEDAGYRSCKRCRPDLASPYDPQTDVITRACESIARSGAKTTVEALAKEAGLTKFHFHRQFKKVTGMTPIEYRKSIEASKARITEEGEDRDVMSDLDAPEGDQALQADTVRDLDSVIPEWPFLGLSFGEDTSESLPLDFMPSPTQSSRDFMSGTSLGTSVMGTGPPVTYTIRPTIYGPLLLAFDAEDDDEIRHLELGDNEGDLELTVRSKFVLAELGVLNDLQESHVMGILDAVERPTGKIVQLNRHVEQGLPLGS